ncbi:MAG: DUF2953 domain-containing protein [Clostridia bacterium]|nr:DUF2953 domain-containing protein [Clostridia bacterium]
MLLVFCILLLIIIILSSKIKFIIKANNSGHKAYALIYIFKVVCVYKVNIDDLKKTKMVNKIRNKKIPSKKLIIKIIKNLNIKLDVLKINMKFGANDSSLTAIITGIIYSIIYILFPIFNLKIDLNKDNFYINIIQVFDNKNVLNLNFKCIINIKLVHIISTIYKCKKDWRCKDYGRKSSNRRAYGNSNG